MRFGMLALLVLLSPFTWAAKPAVVLVPGFFNSLADGSSKGPYFSRTVVRTIQDQGFDVYVVDNLKPVGSVETNANLLLDFLRRMERIPGLQDRGLILIGHSAGGLYSLRAMTLDPYLPVTTLATISTPYHGVNFVEKLTDSAVIRKLVEWIRLGALMELTPTGVRQIMGKIRIPSRVRIINTGGAQKPCFLLGCARAERLSWLLTISGHLNGEDSDGVVPYASALGLNAERMDDAIHLEHWEQVLDSRVFSLLGVANTGYVEKEQRRFYTALLQQITN